MSSVNSPVSEENHQVKIGPRTLLFDLNKDLHNFDIYFEVESENSEEEFHVRVLTQKQLDQSSQDILQQEDNFKKTKGYINGNVKSQENSPENHFLALRAPKDMNLSIKTRILPIPTTSSPSSTSIHSNSMQTMEPESMDSMNSMENSNLDGYSSVVPVNPMMTTVATASVHSGGLWGRVVGFCIHPRVRSWVFYILVGVLILGSLYYVFVYRKKTTSNKSNKSSIKPDKEDNKEDKEDEKNETLISDKVETEKGENGEDGEEESGEDEGESEEADGEEEEMSETSSHKSSSSTRSSPSLSTSFQDKLKKYLKKKGTF